MALNIKPLWGDFGAEIEGFDINAEHDEDTWRQVIGAAHRYGVIRVPGERVEPGRLEYFATMFGEPSPHILEHLRLPGHPSILKLSNIVVDGVQWGIYDGANYWHTDMAYEDPPGAATIVHAIKVPAAGGGTRVADMYAAYDGLSEAMKKRIEDLVVLHHYGNRDDLDEDSFGSASKLTEEQKKKVKNVFHKLAKRHPATGRKALYGVSGSSFGIVGMPDDEAIDLLNELKAHATQERYVHRISYTVGDTAVWDNNCTLHAAQPMNAVNDPEDINARLLYRISVKGYSPLFDGRAV